MCLNESPRFPLRRVGWWLFRFQGPFCSNASKSSPLSLAADSGTQARTEVGSVRNWGSETTVFQNCWKGGSDHWISHYLHFYVAPGSLVSSSINQKPYLTFVIKTDIIVPPPRQGQLGIALCLPISTFSCFFPMGQSQRQ